MMKIRRAASINPAPATANTTRGTDDTPAQNMTTWMQTAASQAAFANIASHLTAIFEEAQSATAESQLSCNRARSSGGTSFRLGRLLEPAT